MTGHFCEALPGRPESFAIRDAAGNEVAMFSTLEGLPRARAVAVCSALDEFDAGVRRRVEASGSGGWLTSSELRATELLAAAAAAVVEVIADAPGEVDDVELAEVLGLFRRVERMVTSNAAALVFPARFSMFGVAAPSSSSVGAGR